MTNIQKIIHCFIIPFLWGCIESDDILLDETTEEYQLYDYYVDEYGNEGIVAHIEEYDDGLRSIIVLSADEAYLPWGPIGEIVFQATDSLKYPSSTYRNASFGVTMLNLMHANGIDKYPAMAWCDQKNKKGFPSCSSWRLPTRNELNDIWGWTIKKNIDKMNSALSDIGGVSVNRENYYWTCAEDYEDYFHTVFDKNLEQVTDPLNNAIATQPESRDKNCWLKKSYNHVRAIKYIYLHKYGL